MTQKELILKAISERNLSVLADILDENIRYFGASKKVFLQKLEYIFEQLRLTGMEIECHIDESKSKPNTYYICFAPFSFRIKTIFKEDNGKVIGIYNNKKLLSLKAIADLHPLDLYFGEDEKFDFTPSKEYILTLKKCEEAIEELNNIEGKIIASEVIRSWLVKHKALYDTTYKQYKYFRFNDFRHLYSELDFFQYKLQYWNDAAKANDEYGKLGAAAKNKWYIKYDRLFFCQTMGLSNPYLYIDGNIYMIKIVNLDEKYLSGEDCSAIIDFNLKIEKYYNFNGTKIQYLHSLN